MDPEERGDNALGNVGGNMAGPLDGIKVIEVG